MRSNAIPLYASLCEIQDAMSGGQLDHAKTPFTLAVTDEFNRPGVFAFSLTVEDDYLLDYEFDGARAKGFLFAIFEPCSTMIKTGEVYALGVEGRARPGVWLQRIMGIVEGNLYFKGDSDGYEQEGFQVLGRLIGFAAPGIAKTTNTPSAVVKIKSRRGASSRPDCELAIVEVAA